MKKLILVSIMIFWGGTLLAREFRIGNNLSVQGEIIASSSSCVVIETKDAQGRSLFWVVSEIFNDLIPDAAKYICLQIAGRNNQAICDAIYNGVVFIRSAVSFAKSIPRFIGNTMEFIAERGSVSSFLRFSTESIEFALNAKSTFEAYKKLNFFHWTDISENYEISPVQYLGNLQIGNVTSTSFTLSVSNDGIDWKEVVLLPGEFKKIEIWENTLQQSYGFIKGSDMCNYQIFVQKEYKLRWNKDTKTYYIETL